MNTLLSRHLGRVNAACSYTNKCIQIFSSYKVGKLVTCGVFNKIEPPKWLVAQTNLTRQRYEMKKACSC